MGFIFVSAGHGGFEGSLWHPGAVQTPGYIRKVAFFNYSIIQLFNSLI